ncbi:MAG: hypothetical protein E6848_08565, partial [Bradyrhizobium sp.]|nr:hypothetical protein [Bradyrhizobium sp.]
MITVRFAMSDLPVDLAMKVGIATTTGKAAARSFWARPRKEGQFRGPYWLGKSKRGAYAPLRRSTALAIAAANAPPPAGFSS